MNHEAGRISVTGQPAACGSGRGQGRRDKPRKKGNAIVKSIVDLLLKQ